VRCLLHGRFKRKRLQHHAAWHWHEQFGLQRATRRIAQRDVERRRGDLIRDVDAGLDLRHLHRLRVNDPRVGRNPHRQSRSLRDHVGGEKKGTKKRLHAAMMIQAADGVCKRGVKRTWIS